MLKVAEWSSSAENIFIFVVVFLYVLTVWSLRLETQNGKTCQHNMNGSVTDQN